MANRSLKPAPGLSAPMIGSIPNGPITGEWFRQFITNYLNPYSLQGTQGQGSSAAQTPPFTTMTNSPVNALTVLSNTAGTTQSTWVPGQTVHLPDAVALDIDANGGVVEILFNQIGPWGNGYIARFDARNGEVAGQLIKMTGGVKSAIGTLIAAANTAALSGTYRLIAVMGLNGLMSVYVDGALQCKATDTTYALGGATYLATEVVSGTSVWAPTSIDGTLDYVADGVQFVHLASSHASGNVAYNFRGVYAAGNSYVRGDEVVYGQTYWLATNPSTGSAPSTSNANWQAVASYNAFQGPWSGVINYVIGDEVTNGGNYWVCVAPNVNSAPSTTNANWQIAGPATLDDVNDGSQYIRGTQYAGSQIVVPNPNALAGTSGWSTTENVVAGATLLSIAGGPSANGRTFLASVSAQYQGASPTQMWKCVAGDVFTLSAFVAVAGPPGTTITGYIVFGDGAFNGVGNQAFSTTSTGWVSQSTTLTAPATAAYVYIVFRREDAAGGVASLYFTNVHLVRQASLDTEVKDGSTYMRFLGSYMDGSRRVASANGGISPLGSIPPWTTSCAFTYSSSSSQIDVNWTAGTIYFADGTTAAVSLKTVAVTGLAASTTYYFPIYFDPVAGTFEFVTGASGAVGSPAIAYTSKLGTAAAGMVTNAYSTYGWFTGATVASGSGGGGGGGGCCLNGEQTIELASGKQVLAGQLEVGDQLTCPSGPVRITKLRMEPWHEWFRVTLSNGVSLFTAGDHRFMDPTDAEICARDLRLQQVVQARGAYTEVVGLAVVREPGVKVSIEVEEPHTYYVRGILSHNKVLC